MTMKQLIPFFFLLASIIWLVVGVVSTMKGETQVMHCALFIMFAGLGLVRFYNQRSVGEEK